MSTEYACAESESRQCPIGFTAVRLLVRPLNQSTDTRVLDAGTITGGEKRTTR